MLLMVFDFRRKSLFNVSWIWHLHHVSKNRVDLHPSNHRQNPHLQSLIDNGSSILWWKTKDLSTGRQADAASRGVHSGFARDAREPSIFQGFSSRLVGLVDMAYKPIGVLLSTIKLMVFC